MAFNPFNIFRRNQKVIFAIITVFVMFTFVLSSGAFGNADFFNWLPNWIGSKTQRGAPLFELDGKQFYPQELQNVRMQRNAANQYMSMAVQSAIMNINRDANNLLGKVSPANQAELQSIHDAIINPQANRGQILQQQRRAQAILAKKDTAGTDAEVARYLEALATFIAMRIGVPQEVYFTNISPRTDRDLVEFLLWRKKADKLGINFTEKDVQALVNTEFLGKLGSDEAAIRRRVLEERKISDGRLWEALNDEFRVRLAQTSVLGSEMRRPSGPLNPWPVYSTPFDLYSTYRDEFSPTTYEMLQVPVANYIDQVKETPTAAELDKLYQEYKSVEPKPESDKPGFKEPRKAKIEWIGATGREPYYTKAAEEWLRKGELLARLGGVFTFPPSVAQLSANLVTAIEPELAIQAPYQPLAERMRSDLEQQYIGGRAINLQVQESNRFKPANFASAVFAIGGSLQSGGPAALVGIGAFELNAIAQERQARLKVGLPLLLGSLVPYASFGPAITQAYEAAQALPKIPDSSYFQAELHSKMQEVLAHNLLSRDLNEFRKELATKTRDIRDPAKKKAAVAAYIEEFVRARGLKQGASKDFGDEYTIGDDPGLAPLKAESSREERQGPIPSAFGKSFFYVNAFESPEGQQLQAMFQQAREQGNMQLVQQILPLLQRLGSAPPSPSQGLYDARPYPTELGRLPSATEEPTYLVWRSEEKPPQGVTPRVAEPKVLAAWKELKARELAKQEAERIATEVKAKNATSAGQVFQNMKDAEAALQAKFPDQKLKDDVKLFQLPGVAPYQIEQNFQSPLNPQIAQFRIGPMTYMPYPSTEAEKKLLDERKQSAGTAFVISDAPKDRFYVAAVASRQEKTDSEFARDVYKAPQGSSVREFVYNTQAYKAMEMQREGSLALLKQEFKYENEDTDRLNKGGNE